MFFSRLPDIPSLSKKLISGETKLSDFYQTLIESIEQKEPHILALMPEQNFRERVLKDVEELEKTYPVPTTRPPLFGIPIGVKDIFRADGFPTTCGSKLPPELFEGKEAECVTALKKLGAIVLGKTVTTEFAYFQAGPTRNPRNTGHTPGGSSSGSAAAVATGYCPFAFGTQTIGSVIRPASYCGVVGFKPSFARISTEGVIPFSWSADHIGFFTQDLTGAELMAAILCNHWKSDTVTPNAPVIGIPEGSYLEQADTDVMDSFNATVEKLEENGIVVKRIKTFDTIEEINRVHRMMTAAELAMVHKDWFLKYRDLYGIHTLQMIEAGQKIVGSELETAKDGRFELRNRLHEEMDENGIDLWVSPSTTTLAPEGLASTGSPLMNLPWTYAGMPSVTIPTDISQKGLPFGLQIIGRFNEDEILLKHAIRINTLI
jgi:Asp-tRNA(Asn)/Glu-tRNA(Gln) amidotransferase A subunit family amidase